MTAAHRIAGIVLAAGRSSRMAGANKLLERVDNKPMVRVAVEAAVHGNLAPVIVVTGFEPNKIASMLGGLDTVFAHNPNFAAGLSTSLAAGIAAVPEACEAACVLLADMPGVTADHVQRLIAAFDPGAKAAICVPVYKGQRGNPVLFAREFFPAMMSLSGDVGARSIVKENAAQVREVEMPDAGVLADVDTPEALHRARAAR